MIKSSDNPRRDFEKASAEIIRLKDKVQRDKEKILSLTSRIKTLESSKERYISTIAEKDAIIKKLENELARATALLNRDSTNTGIPTSQTPINKQKHIPNSRQPSTKPKGGQIGHKKASLSVAEEPEDIEIIDHYPESDSCPSCGLKDCTPTGKSDVKTEYDVRIKVVKNQHRFHYYKCNKCGKVFRSDIPPNLKEPVQYGSELQAVVLSLMNTANASMNKASEIIKGFTGGCLVPCDGYMAKLQKRAGKYLGQFKKDLKLELITRLIVYWDDTVINIFKKRSCFRFYGDETIAYYTAHAHKDMEGLDDDNVLNLLTEETKVMHDHNMVNYNNKYHFKNLECNQHLQRDCQKNTDNTCHNWSTELKNLISLTIKDRNELVKQNKSSFDSSYISSFNEKLSKLLSDGWAENQADSENYGAEWERTLLKRIDEYREAYFSWIKDFTLPTTNNLSERSLRGIKNHMKISGQFESVEAADNHALIKTYIETCRRNHINEIDALTRLCEGNPYTVAEIFGRK